MSLGEFLVGMGATLAIPAWVVGQAMDRVWDIEADWPFRICATLLVAGVPIFILGALISMWSFLVTGCV